AIEHDPQHARETIVFQSREIGAGAEVAAGTRQHEHPRRRLCVNRFGDRGGELVERCVIDRIPTFGAIDRDDLHHTSSLSVDHSITATRSPSLICVSGATAISVTVPATGATTGISIFIDSRMTSSSPTSTSWPTSTRTCHTLAVISARTSVMPAAHARSRGYPRGPWTYRASES